MGTLSTLSLILLLTSMSAWCVESDLKPDPKISEACAKKDPSLLNDLIANCSDCNAVDAAKIISDASDLMDGIKSSDVVAAVVSNPAALSGDIGSDKDWKNPKAETKKSQKKTFGDQSCAAYVANFPPQNSRVTFVGTLHVHEYPATKSEVFSMIKDQFNAKNPDAVIIEAPEKRLTCSEELRIYLSPDYTAEHTAIESEADYTMRLALHAGKKIIAGDLADDEDWGCREEDKKGLQLLREFNNHSKEVAKTPQEIFAAPDFKNKTGWTYVQFQTWYKKMNKTDFALDQAHDDITPAGSALKPKGTNRLAETVALHRDQNVLNKTHDQLLNGSNVMTVFGKDHIETQLPVYEKVFGKQKAPVAKCSGGLQSNANVSSCVK